MSEPDRKEPSFGLPGRQARPGSPPGDGSGDGAGNEAGNGEHLPALRGEKALRSFPLGPTAGARTGARAGRGIAYVLAALLLLFLLYAATAKVDRIVTGSGAVMPFGETVAIVQPTEIRIAALLVRQGDLVSVGMSLVEVEPTASADDLAPLQSRLDRLEAEALRLEAEATGSDLLFPSELQARRPDVVQSEAKLFETRRAALDSRRATVQAALADRIAEVRAQARRLGRLQDSLAVLRDQADSLEALLDRGYAAESSYQAVRRQLAETGEELARARRALAEAEAADQEARRQLDLLEQDWQSQVLDELTATLAERDAARTELDRQQAALRQSVVRAPVDGVISGLTVTDSGQTVAANQPIMQILPVGDSVRIEAKVRDADSPFIEPGLGVRIEIEGYDASVDGALRGTVERIWPDPSPDPEDDTLFHRVEVRSDTSSLQGGRRPVRVLPGMKGRVEFPAGQQTLLGQLADRLEEQLSAILPLR